MFSWLRSATCLINNEFAVELLKDNDLFIHTINDRVVLKKDVDISNNIPFKNDNNFSLLIPSVPINVSTKKDSIKHRLLANNKDVGIPNKIDVNIPQNKDVNIPSKNNNQSSLHVTVPRNKLFNQLSVTYHVSTNDKDISIPINKDIDIPKKKM